MTPPLLSVADVARRIGVHPNTVYRMIREKEIPARKVGRQGYRITEDELQAYLEPHRPCAPPATITRISRGPILNGRYVRAPRVEHWDPVSGRWEAQE